MLLGACACMSHTCACTHTHTPGAINLKKKGVFKEVLPTF